MWENEDLIQYLLVFLDEREVKSDEKRLGRRRVRHAQNVVPEKQSVRHNGSCSRSGTWSLGFWEERNCVSRTFPLLVKFALLVRRATAVYDMVMILF